MKMSEATKIIEKDTVVFLLSFILLCTLISIVILVFKSRTWPLGCDAAFFHYIAWLITEGRIPYREIFDVQFPGTYMVHLLVIKLLGDGDIAWRSFDLLCLASINALILLFAKPFGRLSALIAVALFSSFHLYNGPLYLGQRDYYLIFFFITALHCFARHMEKGSDRICLAMSGLLLGAAISIKPYAGLLCLMLMGICIVHAILKGNKWLTHCFVFMLSSSFVPALLMVWLWAIGGLSSFVDILTNYLLPFYSKFKLEPISSRSFFYFSGLTIYEICIIGVIAFLSLCINRECRARRLLLFTGMIYGFFNFFFQVRNSYQLYPFIFFVFMIIASWANKIKCLYPMILKYFSIIILFHACLLALYRSSSSIINPPVFHITDFQIKNAFINKLQGRVPPGETVQVMDCIIGAIHSLYVMHYHQPTRFNLDAHFFHDIEEPYIQNLRREFIHDLQQKPPLFFVITISSWPITGYERLDKFPELKTWLFENYVTDSQTNYFTIYKRK